MPSAAHSKQALNTQRPLSSSRVQQQDTIRALREMLNRKDAQFTQQTEAQNLRFKGFDALLPQGLPRGSMATISGKPSCGKTSLALSLASSITRAGGYAVLVDGTGHIFPPALRTYEAQLSHLLLVRVPRGERNPNRKRGRLFWATHQVLRSGLFDLVVLLGLNHCPSAAIRQLQLASEQSSSVLFMVHAKKLSLPGGPFHTRIEIQEPHPDPALSILQSPIAAPTRRTIVQITERGRTKRTSFIAHL